MAKVNKKAAKGKAIGAALRKAASAVKATVAKAKAKAVPVKGKGKAAAVKAKAPAKPNAAPAKAAGTKAKVAPAKAKPAKAKPAKAKAAPAKAKAAPAKAKAAAPVNTKPAASMKAAPEKPKQSVKSAKAEPAASSANGIEVGSRAPSFVLNDQSGSSVSSAELAGKPYVLYFYPKDDTSGCTAEACGFRDSGPKFGERGVRIIGVSPDSEASHAKFASKYGLPFTLLADPDKQLIQAYGAWVEKQNYGRTYMGVQRSTFLIGADGTVQKAWRSVKVPGHVDAVLAATES